MASGSVCVVGSANLDIVARSARHPRPGETLLGSEYAEHAGGKGLNQAIAARRAGATTVFLGAVGDDHAGRTLLRVMSAEGLDTGGVSVGDEPTGRAVIVVSDDGENSIIVVPGANSMTTPPSVPPCDVLLVQLEIPIAVVTSALTQGRALGATTVLNPAPSQELSESVLERCDYVVPNEHELDALGGIDRLFALGVRAVLVTKGAGGVDIVERSTTTHVDALDVTPVDTTGAGDTFCGYVAARLAGREALPAAVRRAAVAAGMATTRLGAVPSIPTSKDVDARDDQ